MVENCGYLYALGRLNGVSLRKLHWWCDDGHTVQVEYRGAQDLGAVGVRLR